MRILLLLILFAVNSLCLTAQETNLGMSRLLTPEEFYVKINSADLPLIIDARTWMEFKKDRIPGARLTESSTELKEAVDSLDMDHAILVYCDDNQRSTVACNFLKDWGYTNVSELAGGMIAWKLASYEVDIQKIKR
jgi:rhodanese-related sulfurtransferase